MRRSAGLEKWWIAGALAVLLAAGSAQAQDPVKGGSLVVARVADIFTFDPYNTQDDRSIFTELTLYDRLVKLSPDGKKVEPELATAWTVAPDGLTADFTLRDGVKFSDGSPLTAEDVVFSLSRAIDQKGSWGFLFQPVKSVAKVDDKTVRLTMSEPFAPLLPALSTFAASIYQKANFEKQGDEAGEHPLGTGAFMLDHWDKGQQVVLKRNPNYWQEGKPYLDEVIFRTVGDDNARALQLASGEVQLITDVPVSLADQVAGQGGNVATVKGSAVGFITINEKVKPLDDAAARCALCLCDRSRRDRQDRLFRPRHPGQVAVAQLDILLRFQHRSDRLRSRQGQGAAGQELGAARLRAARRKCRAATPPIWRRRRSGLPRWRRSASR